MAKIEKTIPKQLPSFIDSDELLEQADFADKFMSYLFLITLVAQIFLKGAMKHLMSMLYIL